MAKENQNKLDVCDWVLSPEIRDHLRTARPLTIEEKAEIIDSGCRSLWEKYDALALLLQEAQRAEDRKLVADLRKLYDWAFAELHSQRPGQVFLFHARRWKDDALDRGPQGVDAVFRTYGELETYFQAYEGYYHDAPVGYPDGIDDQGYVEKWAEVDGKMQSVLGLDILLADRKIILQNFDPWYLEDIREDDYKTLGIGPAAQRLHSHYTGNTTLPLPFRAGDLVQVETPGMFKPRYGVLSVVEALGRYIHMVYMDGYHLEHMDLSYQQYNLSSGWRVMDWTRPIRPDQLPENCGMLLELSQALHALDENDVAAIDRLFFAVAGFSVAPPRMAFHDPVPLTLAELIAGYQEEE